MENLKIIADENMPYAREVFSRLGRVQCLAGRGICADDVRGADALMVRSVTRVDAALLEGSAVKFVGTATIGTDHVDLDWLAARGIGFASAPGCNATSVAQWVAAALALAAGRRGVALSRSSLGIVGVGNCGSRVERVARALGMAVVLNDPPLARASGDPKYLPLTELAGCDYVALHVPLTREGADATAGLIGEDFLQTLKPGACVINACRGGVLDEQAYARAVAAGRLSPPIIDAWEGEPAINPGFVRVAQLATPHIAGYSFDGKLAGTRMIYEAACRHFGVESELVELDLPGAATPMIELPTAGRTLDSVLAELVLTAYPIVRDDADLRVALGGASSPGERGAAFDARRKLYPLRREFAATRVRLLGAPDDWRQAVAALGFTLAD